MANVGAQYVQAVQPVPVGSLQAYAGANAPTGWLICDGTSYPTATYPDLYNVIGYTYGGSGANFNVPDMRGRMPMGAGTGVGLNASGSGAPTGTAQTARTRGQWGGEETHLLTTAEMPSHNHSIQSMWTDIAGNHQHNVSGTVSAGQTNYALRTDTDTTAIGSSGGGGRHNSIPPFIVTNFIIKAYPDIPRSGLASGFTPPIVSTLPSNPQFGDMVTYAADATNGVYWTLYYDASGTYPWKFVGGAPLTSSAVGTYTTPPVGPTTTYINSGLTGSPVITAPLAGDYFTTVSADAKTSNTTAAPGLFISYASATPASWDGSDSLSGGGAATSYPLGANKRGTVTAASQSIAIVWTNANISGTCSFYSVYMSATPIRVR